MITFENISKKYKDVDALNRISFEIKEGEIFGYIGPNGAGKTTTIKIIVGLIKDFGGAYSFKNIAMPENITQVSRMLGYLPQGVSFQEWRTVDQALTTFGKLSGLNKDELEQQIESLLSLFDLFDVRYKKISKLSGGMIQKVGLIQALLHNPKLLVLDEPLSGLDPASRYEVKSIIKKLSKEGATVFFSSHILSDVQDIADRIAILKKGQILKIGNSDELKSELFTSNVLEIKCFADFGNHSELNTMKGVSGIEQLSSKKFLIHIQDGYEIDNAYFQILKYLVQNNIRVQSFKQVEPNLDEVYLEYIK
jgi:ABC-2 type transport system ATP-binding protein